MKTISLVLVIAVYAISSGAILPNLSAAQWGSADFEQQDFDTAMQEQKPVDRILALRHFLQTYQRSKFEERALEELIVQYHATGDTVRMADAARRLLQVNPHNASAIEAVKTRAIEVPPNRSPEPQVKPSILAETAERAGRFSPPDLFRSLSKTIPATQIIFGTDQVGFWDPTSSIDICRSQASFLRSGLWSRASRQRLGALPCRSDAGLLRKAIT